MEYYLIVARSITMAQRMQRTLSRAGVWSEIRRGPREITELGCGYTLQIKAGDLPAALAALKSNGLGPVQVYLSRGGKYEEMLL